MYKKFLLLSSFLFIYIRCKECDKLGILLYEDLGCKPHNTPGKPCPTHFSCDDFRPSNNHCLFQSQRIPIGQNVEGSSVYSACKVGCRCNLVPRKNLGQIQCAVLDCAEEAFGSDVLEKGCYFTYDLGKCCANGHKCPPFKSKTKCNVNGKEYKEGEQFQPANSCLSCVCKEGFSGKFEAPFCKRMNCAEQIDNTKYLARNCAPVYLDDETLCCPSKWICSLKNDRIRQIGPKSANSTLTCNWGKKKLQLGEGLKTRIEHHDEFKDITCECILPPFLTCKQTKK